MKTYRLLCCLFLMELSVSCIPNEYEEFDLDCATSVSSDWTIVLEAYMQKDPIQIKKEVLIEGYVISSSKEGQFYGEVILQNSYENPSMGMRILTDASHIETLYPRGTKIRINLQGFYIQFKSSSFIVGEALPSFGNIIIGRIPTNVFKEHLNRVCFSNSLTPVKMTIQDLKNQPKNSYVQLDSMRFKKADSLLSFSIQEDETIRMLLDCKGDSIGLKTSNYATFALELVPLKMGSLQGVLKQNTAGDYLEVSHLNDLNFRLEPCELPPLYVSSNQVLISEWADPSNNSKARFIELYNSSSESISLNGWILVRYTNANTEPGFSIALNDLIIKPQKTLVIASNAETFKSVYGFEADVYTSTASVAGSNGDDQALLIDPFGVIIDRFGILGEDGTGTAHDFEDGKALRKNTITTASVVFNPDQWMIYNKRGGAGTILQSLIAPQDYSPGTHPD